MLVGALFIEGCASYPGGRPLRGQDETAARRDHDACRAQAIDATDSPIAAGLLAKVVMAFAGAGIGAGVMLAGDSGNAEAKDVALAVGIGAGVGFVLGSIAGTFFGIRATADAVQAREYAFSRCMKERGYDVPYVPRR